jgi:hypothetical protein
VGRKLARLAAVGWLALAAPAAAATFLYLAGEPGDGMLEGGQVFITTREATIYPSLRTFPYGAYFAVYPSDGSYTWNVIMDVPDYAPLAPGEYDSAHGAFVGSTSWPPGPHLDVYGPKGCTAAPYGSPASSGRFTIRSVVTSGYQIVLFAADFEQRCAGATGTVRGTIVYASGGIPCFGQPDGTACDDLDPCTHVDVCRDGVCAGTDDVTPTCAAPDACHDAGVCDRLSGTCAPPLRPNGTPCDDGSACTSGDACQAGVCTSGPPTDCDDGSICTSDACDPTTGCTHAAAPGSCWVFRTTTRIVASATGPGGSAECTGRCQSPDTGVLLLGADGTYRFQDGESVVCPSGGRLTVPDEFGTVRRAARGRLILRPQNLHEIIQAARQCVGGRIGLRGYHAWVRPSGNRLAGRSVLHARTRVSGVPVQLTATGRLAGIPGLDGAGRPAEPPAPDERVPVCDANIRVHCVKK